MSLTKNPLAGLAALGLAGMAPSNTGGLNPTGKYYLFFACKLIVRCETFE